MDHPGLFFVYIRPFEQWIKLMYTKFICYSVGFELATSYPMSLLPEPLDLNAINKLSRAKNYTMLVLSALISCLKFVNQSEISNPG